MTETADDIRLEMQTVRSKRRMRVAAVHVQAERMVDWKEHVRASPKTAALISSAIGFLVIRAVLPGASSLKHQSDKTIPSSGPITASTGFVWSLLTPVVSAAVKK